jgi:hypothetical protein
MAPEICQPSPVQQSLSRPKLPGVSPEPEPAPLSSPLSSPDLGSTAVLDREIVEQPIEPGDHERFAHYVRKEKILESALGGTPVVALCGKVWVPGRDPGKFPVCPTCKEIFENLPPGGGDDKGPGSGDGDSGPS